MASSSATPTSTVRACHARLGRSASRGACLTRSLGAVAGSITTEGDLPGQSHLNYVNAWCACGAGGRGRTSGALGWSTDVALAQPAADGAA
jgi:hypothetical protein